MRSNNVQFKRVMWHAPQVSPSGKPTLGWGDGRKVEAGKFLDVIGEPKLCQHGLHAAYNPRYALDYIVGSSPGSLRPLTVVTLWGTVKVANDKAVATRRYCHAIIPHVDAMRVATRWFGVVISRCITSNKVPRVIWALLTEGEYQESRHDEYLGYADLIGDMKIRGWVARLLASYRNPRRAWRDIRHAYSDALYYAASQMASAHSTAQLITRSQAEREHMLYWELRNIYDVLLADTLLKEAGLTEQGVLSEPFATQDSTTDE